MKKILCIVACCFVLFCSVIPASAASFADSDVNSVSTYYAGIPWNSMSVTVNDQVFTMDAFGSELKFAVNGGEKTSLATPIIYQQVGFENDGSGDPVPLVMSVGFDQTVSLTAGAYPVGSRNYYDFELDDSKLSNFSLTLTAQDFVLEKADYISMTHGMAMNLPAGVMCSIRTMCVGYWLNPDGTEWESFTQFATGSVGSAAGGEFLYMPQFGDIAPDESRAQTHSCVVSSFSMVFTFTGTPGRFGMDMAYYPTRQAPADVMSSYVVEIYEKEFVYVDVAPEDLDLFSWIVEPLGSFFKIEFFPGISLGAIIGIGFGVLLLAVFLKWFGGGGG